MPTNDHRPKRCRPKWDRQIQTSQPQNLLQRWWFIPLFLQFVSSKYFTPPVVKYTKYNIYIYIYLFTDTYYLHYTYSTSVQYLHNICAWSPGSCLLFHRCKVAWSQDKHPKNLLTYSNLQPQETAKTLKVITPSNKSQCQAINLNPQDPRCCIT